MAKERKIKKELREKEETITNTSLEVSIVDRAVKLEPSLFFRVTGVPLEALPENKQTNKQNYEARV